MTKTAQQPLGNSIPSIMYGTAWKEDATEGLVKLALDQGFRAIDSANQRKHYFEAATGRAVRAYIESGALSRDQLFIQSKYTFAAGQDARLPYDPNAPISQQVEASIKSTLAHFGTDYLDSFVLHGPSVRVGLGQADRDAWRAMEDQATQGNAKSLGVSNVSFDQLKQLWEFARVKPRFVQNRCYATTGWDHAVREFCIANGVFYQGFSLLTANLPVLEHPPVMALAAKRSLTPAQLIFRFALDVGMIPLTGTTSHDHMVEDLQAIASEPLGSDDKAFLENIATR
jgi:diketogulonate reductase-like aldo/keto reductase